MPARVALQGRIHRYPRTKCMYFWYRNAAVRTFGRAHRHRPYGFVWVDCACGFVCWENGAHEPTPSVLYFCQPRVADDRRLPWVKSWRGTYAIGIVLFKINFRMRKSFTNNPFAACGNDVVMKKSTTPKGVVFSLALLPRVGCVALANPALSKV